MLHYERTIQNLGQRGEAVLGYDKPFEAFYPFAMRLGDVMGDSVATSTEFAAFAKTMYGVAMFVREGSKVFRLSPALGIALAQTQLSRVPCELVKLPFQSVFIEFPKTPSLVRLRDNAGQPTVHCDGAYCTLNGERLDIILAGTREGMDQIAYMTLHLSEGADIPEAMDIAFHTVHANERAQVEQDANAFGREEAQKILQHAAALLFNALLYISSPGADVSAPTRGEATRKLAAHPGKSQEWRDRMRKLARREATLIKVGEKIAANAELAAAHKADCGDKAYTLVTQFRVRGHWRHQPFGPGRAERRLQWVKPYVKGPPLAEMINRTYFVE